MGETRIIKVREDILQQNKVQAAGLAMSLDQAGVVMINVMASPGSGKTSLILETAARLEGFRPAVIEADVVSTVDADRVIAAGIPAVQIETGGFCHVDARMTAAALDELGTKDVDVVFLENVGNLICTAEHATGAHLNVAILSVPEGDDKPLKYPIMFRAVDVVVINKIDFLKLTDFSLERVRDRIRVLNPAAPVIAVSCRTGEGMDKWLSWLGKWLTKWSGGRLATR